MALVRIIGSLSKLITILLLGMMYSHETTAGSYQIQGQISFDYFTGNEKPYATGRSSFSIDCDGKLWRILLKPESLTKGGINQSVLVRNLEASNDGTNTFYVMTPQGSTITTQTNRQSLSAIIIRGNIPYAFDHDFAQIWYAYASGEYLATNKDNLIPSVINFKETKYYGKDFRTQASWSAHESPPFLPRTISFTGNYKFLEKEKDELYQSRIGNTNTFYEALEFKKFDNITYPTKAVYRHFISVPATAGPKERMVKLVTITATNICAISSALGFAPKLDHQAVVEDYRQLDAKLTHTITVRTVNGWPKNDEMNAIYVARLKAQSIRRFPIKELPRYVFLIIVLLPALIFLTVYKPNKHSENKKLHD